MEQTKKKKQKEEEANNDNKLIFLSAEAMSTKSFTRLRGFGKLQKNKDPKDPKDPKAPKVFFVLCNYFHIKLNFAVKI